jgi:two-component system chemotaxis sensor kinase CheA
MINECVELPQDQISEERCGVMNLRGEPLSFVRLRQVIESGASCLPTRENVVVLHHENRLAGIAVDKLLGECQAIIKPLSRLFKDVKCVSGSTILDDGRVALILDVSSLLGEVTTTQTQIVS